MPEIGLNEIELLEEFVIDNEFLLVIRKEEAEPEGKPYIPMLRFRYASMAQRREAAKIRQKAYAQMEKDPELRSQPKIERQYKTELAEIKREVNEIQKAIENVQTQYITNLPDAPNRETDPEGYEKFRKKWLDEPLFPLEDRMIEANARQERIMSLSIDYIAGLEFIDAMTWLCWDQCEGQDENGKEIWKPLWSCFEEYKQDRAPIVTFLHTMTSKFLAPNSDFFEGLPSRLVGVRGF